MSQEPETKVRVAVVDDSTFIRKAILRMLDDEPQIEVVGSAGSGEELLTHLDEWRPDVITLDLDMPGMGGLATLDRIMAQRPTPVIILSTHSGKGAPLTIEALHRGATDFIDKQQYSLVDFEALRAVLIEKIFHVTGRDPATRAGGDAVRGRRGAGDRLPSRAAMPRRRRRQPRRLRPDRHRGLDRRPADLQRILEDLGDSISVPMVVVQHMPVGFTHAFAERLNAYLPLRCGEAQPAGAPAAGHGLHRPGRLAPADRRQDGQLIAETSAYPKDLVHVPSIDVLFDSAAQAVGPRVIGALLTGMGRDGAKGMAALQYRGATPCARTRPRASSSACRGPPSPWARSPRSPPRRRWAADPTAGDPGPERAGAGSGKGPERR